jgi:hypothetical protein
MVNNDTRTVQVQRESASGSKGRIVADARMKQEEDNLSYSKRFDRP